MAVKRVSKEALIGETILFVTSDKESEHESISPSFMSNQIDIISLDAVGGGPVIPTAGTFNIFARTDVDGGFKLVTTNGSMNAILTGGSLLPDGVALGSSFMGLPLEIKIVPTDVNVATAYRVSIKQASVQLESQNVTKDFIFEVAKGNVPGHSLRGFATRSNTIIDSEFRDIWGGGGNIIYPVAAETWEVFSDSADDSIGGTGAQKILIQYLDDDYNIQTIIADLDGLTPVSLNSDMFRPDTAVIVLSGVGKFNQGLITVRDQASGNIRNIIPATVAVDQDIHYTVPAGFTAYSIKVVPYFPKNESGRLKGASTLFGTNTEISSGNFPFYQSPFEIKFDAPFRSPEKRDISFRAQSDNEGPIEVNLVFELLLVDNNFVGI